VRIAEFIAHMRQEAQPSGPLQIKIVNAKELQPPDKVISIKRTDGGKMSGAVVQSIT
jgi:hypothetical protein